MPRKAKKKTDKPPLVFLEQPSCGSRLQTGLEVRAAVNPKDFFTEESKTTTNSTLHAWVSPQFDRSAGARRGRRRLQAAASILDGVTQPASRKTSVCKFPSLTFRTRPRDHRPKKAAERRGTETSDSCRVPDVPSTPPSGVDPPPDVETPTAVSPPHPAAGFLLDQPPTPPCSRPPDSLVADTPERDYGLKVAWRRRRTMMLMLREADLLSESDTRIEPL